MCRLSLSMLSHVDAGSATGPMRQPPADAARETERKAIAREFTFYDVSGTPCGNIRENGKNRAKK
jgi:hypothetical protein